MASIEDLRRWAIEESIRLNGQHGWSSEQIIIEAEKFIEFVLIGPRSADDLDV